MNQLEIAGRKIGREYTPLVIAEIGINHEGSLNVAKEMVDAAYRAGVEAVKHQTHVVDDEMSPQAKKVIPGNTSESIYSVMERCALSEDNEFKLMKYVESKGMVFLSTPFGRAAADRLMGFDVSAFKIGSGECNNYPLIKHISKFNKPMILSTGMNTLDTVAPSVRIMKENDIDFALLHTTNLYPTPNHLVRLGAMLELEDRFNCIVGLSDHTISNHACLGAVALGASLLERHFTDHMGRKGPDIICSMDEKACKELIDGAKILFEQRDGAKTHLTEEQVTRDFAYATVCAIRDIDEGDSFNEENIWVKRPGTGEISASQFEEVLEKKAARNIKKGEHLKNSDLI
ncbi:MAG: N-acetylneuraminate synthase family protein [Cyclobacteriaceae bacterium]